MSRRAKVAVVFGIVTVFGLLEFSYHYLDQLARGHHVDPLIPFVEELTGCYSALVLILPAAWIARRYRNIAHLPALLLGSAAHTSLMWGSRTVLFPMLGLGSYDYGIMPTRYFMEFGSDVLVYATTVVVVMLYDRQVRASELEKSLAKAQLQNLRLQLHPHFLFNTLNTISSVMYEDVRAADRMIVRLSDLLRLSLEQGGSQEVTLEREIEFLRLYVETMKARFEEKLNVTIEADDDARLALVPPLVLQPLVENSIRHGADPASSVVDVRVTAHRDDGFLRLEVRDHGPGIADAALRNGIGLSNTVERLERLYGSSNAVQFSNAPGGGLAVTLRVPFHVNPSAAG